MSVKANAGKLSKTTKQLMLQWGETKQSWRDSKAAELEKKALAGLPSAVDSAIRVMAELDQLLTKIKNDCE